VAAELRVGAGVPRRRGVTAADVVAGEAAAQMQPPPAHSDAITAGGLEVIWNWGQHNGVEMVTASHKPAPFFASI
jgi:hypothetical protein